MSRFERLTEMVKAHPGNPDRAYMNMADFHVVCQEAAVTGGGVPQVDKCRLLGMDVVITDPYGRSEMLVLDSSGYPKARDFKEGRVSAEKLSTHDSK